MQQVASFSGALTASLQGSESSDNILALVTRLRV